MIDLAVEVALRAHQNQVRKGTGTPYITHPLAVGILLAKAGCSDEVWDRFRRGREKQRWYYLSLVDSLHGLSETERGGALYLQFKGEVDRVFEDQGERP
ncbi:MAG: hypothetical protein ABII06_03830 [Pseudomonadota bacterium]